MSAQHNSLCTFVQLVLAFARGRGGCWGSIASGGRRDGQERCIRGTMAGTARDCYHGFRGERLHLCLTQLRPLDLVLMFEACDVTAAARKRCVDGALRFWQRRRCGDNWNKRVSAFALAGTAVSTDPRRLGWTRSGSWPVFARRCGRTAAGRGRPRGPKRRHADDEAVNM